MYRNTRKENIGRVFDNLSAYVVDDKLNVVPKGGGASYWCLDCWLGVDTLDDLTLQKRSSLKGKGEKHIGPAIQVCHLIRHEILLFIDVLHAAFSPDGARWHARDFGSNRNSN